MVEERRAGRAEEAGELPPRIGPAHVDHANASMRGRGGSIPYEDEYAGELAANWAAGKKAAQKTVAAALQKAQLTMEEFVRRNKLA